MRKPCDEVLSLEGASWFCRLLAGHHGLHVGVGRDEKGRSYAITWSSEIEEENVLVNESTYSIDA